MRTVLATLVTTVVALAVSATAAADPPGCVTLPDAVPEWADAHVRNPRVCPPPPPPATSISIQFTDDNTTDPIVWKTSFPIYTTYNVFVAVDVENAPVGSHTAYIEIDTPFGTAWQLQAIPFTVVSAGETARVWGSLPVAGTPIQFLCLTGTWRALVWVDLPPIVSAPFELTSPCAPT